MLVHLTIMLLLVHQNILHLLMEMQQIHLHGQLLLNFLIGLSHFCPQAIVWGHTYIVDKEITIFNLSLDKLKTVI